jgi:chitin disaccharide deacetylase
VSITRKRLVVVADDFGMHPAVDRAVLALALQGRLSGTSVLSLGAHWRESASWLTDAPLQVGLHVDLPPGYESLPRAMLAAWLRAMPVKTLERSLDAQFAAFDAHRHRPPDYVDGHRHVHQWPRLRDLLLERWQRHYGAQPGWARATRPLAGADFKARMIHTLGGEGWEQRLHRRGIAHNAAFLGVYDFRADAAGYRALLTQWLRDAPDGALLMCHPADGSVPEDAIAPARVAEYQVWAADELTALLGDQRVSIASGKELPALWNASRS